MSAQAKSITQQACESYAAAKDPRFAEVMTALTRHLHAFVEDVRPSEEEWMQAIQFLTRVGKMCQGSRQEFILLSDVLGVSMLLDQINHTGGAEVTDSTVLGPFYVENPPVLPLGTDLATDVSGEPLWVEFDVTSQDGTPIDAAIVDVWQSDSEGFYDVQKGDDLSLRARFLSENGKVRFWSILPTQYPIPYDGPVGDLLQAAGRHPWRPAHLHVKIQTPGHQPLTTHLFVSSSDYLDSDVVFGVKPSLIVTFGERSAGVAPDGRKLDKAWRTLEHQFRLGENASVR